jgi:hypothetical protein
MTIGRLISNLDKIDLEKVVQEVVTETKDEILHAQREQLLEGKLSTGQDITPSYLEDPYFKSRESAQRYSDWKDKITPNPKRKKGVPNLFIVGTFHNSISVDVTTNSVVFDASFKKPDIIRKFSENIFGLNPEKAGQYSQEHLAPEATRRIRKKIFQ